MILKINMDLAKKKQYVKYVDTLLYSDRFQISWRRLYILRLFLTSFSLLGKCSLILQIARRQILSTSFSIHYSPIILFFDALHYALFKA
jgi:hypothetical protein